MTDIRPGRFELMPPVIKNIIIINVVVFLIQRFFESRGGTTINDLFALHDIHSEHFKLYQLITHMFMHGGWDHIFFNMLALWMFGSTLENYWGSKRFLTFYVVCGLGAAALHLATLYYQNDHLIRQFQALSAEDQKINFPALVQTLNEPTLGASGAVFGCLAAFGYLFPNSIIYINLLFPVKAKWMVIFYAGMELWLGIRNSAGDSVAHWAHLGGALVGFLLVLYWNRTNRRTFY